MKKFISLLLATVLAGALAAGCAGSSSDSGSNGASSGGSSSSETAAQGDSGATAAENEGSSGSSAGESMQPVTADMVADGTYDIAVDSSSSMFNIESCQLTVAQGQMTALVTLHGHGYEKLFMGTSQEAESASDDRFAYYTDEDGDGHYSYTVPVEALDDEVPCAAFSIKKQQWYDRTLVFESDGIPADKITR